MEKKVSKNPRGIRTYLPLEQLSQEEKEKVKRPRVKKLIAVSNGGNAGENSHHFRVSLPAYWTKILGVTKEDREVILVLREDDKEVAIVKKEHYESIYGKVNEND